VKESWTYQSWTAPSWTAHFWQRPFFLRLRFRVQKKHRFLALASAFDLPCSKIGASWKLISDAWGY
jgi:hypothetical protein